MIAEISVIIQKNKTKQKTLLTENINADNAILVKL